MHALIIEDDALLAMMIEDELRELGFTSVVTASTEEEAVSSIAMRCPDLVTSDGSLLAEAVWAPSARSVRHVSYR